MKSQVAGVYWVPSKRKWLARDVRKKTLYRGDSRDEAEAARMEYDNRPSRQPQTKPRRQMFCRVPECCWKPTGASYGLEQSYEQ